MPSIRINYKITNSTITLTGVNMNGVPIQYKDPQGMNWLILPNTAWTISPLIIEVQPRNTPNTLNSVTVEGLLPLQAPARSWKFRYETVGADGLCVEVIAKRGSTEKRITVALLPLSSADIDTAKLHGQLDTLLLKPPRPQQTTDAGPVVGTPHGPGGIRGTLPTEPGKRPRWQDSDGNTTDTGDIVGPMNPPANVVTK